MAVTPAHHSRHPIITAGGFCSPTEFTTEVRKTLSAVKGMAEPGNNCNSFWQVSGEARNPLAWDKGCDQTLWAVEPTLSSPSLLQPQEGCSKPSSQWQHENGFWGGETISHSPWGRCQKRPLRDTQSKGFRWQIPFLSYTLWLHCHSSSWLLTKAGRKRLNKICRRKVR